MGSVISWFRKKPIEKVLEELDSQIKALEERRLDYRNNWRSRISALLLYFTLLEVFYCLYFYFFVRPAPRDALETSIWAAPILLWPAFGWALRYMINAYYTRRIATSDHRLEELRVKKRNKVEELAKATDFYRLQSLMNKYSEKPAQPQPQARGTPRKAMTLPAQRPPSLPSQSQPNLPLPASPGRSSSFEANRPASSSSSSPPVAASASSPSLPVAQSITPSLPPPPVRSPSPVPVFMPVPSDRRRSDNTQQTLQRSRPPVRQGPPPVDSRSMLDKFVDFLMTDTPSGELEALVCKQCGNHNGLVPKDEIPLTPNADLQPTLPGTQSSFSSSSSSSSSSSASTPLLPSSSSSSVSSSSSSSSSSPTENTTQLREAESPNEQPNELIPATEREGGSPASSPRVRNRVARESTEE